MSRPGAIRRYPIYFVIVYVPMKISVRRTP